MFDFSKANISPKGCLKTRGVRFSPSLQATEECNNFFMTWIGLQGCTPSKHHPARVGRKTNIKYLSFFIELRFKG